MRAMLTISAGAGSWRPASSSSVQEHSFDRSAVDTVLLTGRVSRAEKERGSGSVGGARSVRTAVARAALSVPPGLAAPLDLLAQNERTPRGSLSGFSVNWAVT